ncbi:MAG: permease-like cell division protein FtsX [Nitrospirales bacterium]
MRRFTYVIKEAFANIRLNRTTSLIALATTAFTLACFGVFLLLYFNLRGVADSLQEEVKVIVYAQDSLTGPQVTELGQRLKREREVGTITYVSKEQALHEFRAQFPTDQHLLEGLGENPLPASFVITLAPRYRNSEAVSRWTQRLQEIPGVFQVQYSRDWIENLTTLIGFIELAAIAVGAILSAASVTIIANTIRLTLYARRDEIEIMRMIGATSAFIKIPYLLEGALLGALGGLLSVMLLKGSFEVFKYQLGSSGRFLGIESGFGFFPLRVSVLMVLVGLVLGWAGSLMSLVEFGRPRT